MEISDDRAECIQNIGEKFVAEYFDRDEKPQLSIKTYGYSIVLKCFGLFDTLALEDNNWYPAAAESASPVPSGTGVFLLDLLIREFPMNCPVSGMPMEVQESAQSGIRVFRRGVVDTSGILYGTEYTQKEINEALEQGISARELDRKD